MRSSTKFGQLIRFKSGLLAIKYALFPLIIVAAQLAFGQTPTTQVSGITFEPVPGPNQNTTIKINWATNGNGGNRLVVLKDATGVFNPVDNTNTSTFNANADYTANVTDLDAGAGVVKAVAVISGGGQTITVTNIPANTMLAVQIFEFGDSPASPDYNLATNATNPRSFQFFTSNGTKTSGTMPPPP